MKIVQNGSGTPPDIPALIATLDSDDGLVRQHARQVLVRIGPASVPDLIEKLADPNDRLRWETAKVLGKLCDSRAAPALVGALEDDNPGIRWVAAKGLINLGHAGLAPLLGALEQHPDSVRLREGAHHVLTAQRGWDVKIKNSVLSALEAIEPTVELPLAAHAALKMLQYRLQGDIPAPNPPDGQRH